MHTTIYYFTGSGNSLAAARRIAAELPSATIRRITNNPGSVPAVDSQCIGFVFPTYAYGLPRIVEEFVAAVPLPENAYLFGIASNCGIPGPVLKQLNKVLAKRKKALHSGFTILDPSSSLVNDPDRDAVQRLMTSANRENKPQTLEKRLPHIVETVLSQRKLPLETSNGLTNFLGGLLYRLALRTFKESGKDFWTSDLCTGCGTCVRLCPRQNITIEQGIPKWGPDCELCHACIQWCPNTAIQYKHLTEHKLRYRNPNVSVSDMVPEHVSKIDI